jgi:hypothetical protein
LTGTTTLFHWDPVERAAYLETKTDITPVIERNKALLAMAGDGWKGDGFHHVASIPMSDEFWHVISGMKRVKQADGTHTYEAQAGEDGEKQMLKILNDNQYLKLRTKGGKL